MGVDNREQINNVELSGTTWFCQRLVKPEINSRAGYLIDDEVKKLINDSGIICIYGMSLGETDKTWWVQIANWIVGSDRRLIIFARRDSSTDTSTHSGMFDREDDVIDHFFDVAGVNGPVRESLRKKIYVIINADLFDIDLVKLTEIKRKEEKIKGEASIANMKSMYEVRRQLAEIKDS